MFKVRGTNSSVQSDKRNSMAQDGNWTGSAHKAHHDKF